MCERIWRICPRYGTGSGAARNTQKVWSPSSCSRGNHSGFLPECLEQHGDGAARASTLARRLRPSIATRQGRRPGQEVAIPVAAILDDAPLGRKINIDEAETLGVALTPLEVVHEG